MRQPVRIDRIDRHVVSDLWTVIFDNKPYTVVRRVMVSGGVTPECWTVEGGGNRRSVMCDENGATYKRVVTFVKSCLELVNASAS